MASRVAILIVTFNSATDLESALASIDAQSVDAEVHVWDNASRDGTREIAGRFPQITLHAGDINLGFCAANNRLLALTSAPFVLFLNPDARLRPGCLDTLLAALENAPPNVAAIAPKMIKPPRDGEPARIDSAGIRLSRRNLSPHDRGEGEIDHGQYDAPREIFGASFACALWRRAAIDATTLDGQFLDDDFFAYYEDVDVAWRARRVGWTFLCEPRAVCEHRRSSPGRRGPALAARAFVNRWLLLIANENGDRGWLYLLCLIPREKLRFLWHCLRTPGIAVGWRLLAAGWRGAWRKRRLLAGRRGQTNWTG